MFKYLILPCAIISPATAAAVQYLDLEQAQKIIFPTATKLEVIELKITKIEAENISDKSGVDFEEQESGRPKLEVYLAKSSDVELGYLIVHEVVGKHEYITYAAGITLAGKIIAVEIMDYRENLGGQIMDEQWRKQFHGKSATDHLILGEDIKNISGATYSSKHLTEGLRQLLSIFELKIKK